MGQVSYRANLSASTFPLVSQNQGQTVIVKQQDNTYVPSVTSKEDSDKDSGVPQIYYCHNVLPHAQGFGAIGYTKICNPRDGSTAFNSVFSLRDSNENKAYFCHAKDNSNYILLPGAVQWLQINTVAGAAGRLVTTASISGVTYIYFSGIGCYRYDFGSNALVAVTLSGLDASNVVGISTTSGYMIAWTAAEIAWSSTIDPTDFVPSLTTGAGGGGVEGAKGGLQVCLSTTAGFIIYTTNNAIFAAYSGNSRYPFNFREVVGSGGLSNPELAAADGNSGAQYAYTTYGIQSVGIQLAQTILPEVTDFIAGSYFEDFDEFTLMFTQTVLDVTMLKKVTMVAARYLVISYGVTSLTHALVYDIALKRYGKLKINHVDCFEYNILDPEVVESPKKSLAFLQQDGTVYLVDSSFGSPLASGVMLLGKYQYLRQRMLQMDTVQLENVRVNSFFKLYNLPSIDGKNVPAISEGYLLESNDLFRKYGFSDVGINHSLLFLGGFYIVSLVLNFNIHGRQ